MDHTLQSSVALTSKPSTSRCHCADCTRDFNINTYANSAEDFFARFDKFRDSYEPFLRTNKTEPVRVAILDTGVDQVHAAVSAAEALGCFNRKQYYSWIPDTNVIRDENGHGTQCAAMLQRVAPDARIYVARIFGGDRFDLNEAENIAKAINHAVDKWNVDIISMSFGLRSPSKEQDNARQQKQDNARYHKICDSIYKAIKAAEAKDKIIFAAASNGGKNDRPSFPASSSKTICIHAANGKGEDGGINPRARSGENFMTLGIDIKSTNVQGDHVYLSGTSFATPIAAGIAANMLHIARNHTIIREIPRRDIGTAEGMRKMFTLMSYAKGNLSYVAPWQLWAENWQNDKGKTAHIWSSISSVFTFNR
ncbi:subtilisin-like protein [Massarina eburnea CBS 473.64]|uniref:Subtilisin-like protein n=1 Tax=Massarina eburnea CBS 473.64 TaxID=1395130 RepID=A0A6A6RQP3_9PLEO|nr:subtilisin-like protein [Massarina eburnea CBS 473.64]